MDTKLIKVISEFENHEYHFYIQDYSIFLDKFIILKRETTRHKFKVKAFYTRINNRDSTIEERDVILRDELKKGVLDNYISKLRVKYWSEK